jgi:hypothetical protein
VVDVEGTNEDQAPPGTYDRDLILSAKAIRRLRNKRLSIPAAVFLETANLLRQNQKGSIAAPAATPEPDSFNSRGNK